MKQHYILRLTASLTIALLLSWVAYQLVIKADKKYFHSISKNEFLFLKDTTTYDVLLLGSSRMKNNVNPMVLDSVTGLNTFNAGSSGANAVEVYTILESYLLKHKPPQTVVLALDLFSLESQNALQYYPTYITCNTSPPIETALKTEGVHTSLYKIVPFLKIVELNDYYKGVVYKAAKGETDIAGGDFYYKGFVSNTEQVILDEHPGPRLKFGITEKGLIAVNDIIHKCEMNNITLVFCYAPEYKQLNIRSSLNGVELLALYDSIATVNNIPFLHDEYLDINYMPELFANNGHLNRDGADVYSRLLGLQILEHQFRMPPDQRISLAE